MGLWEGVRMGNKGGTHAPGAPFTYTYTFTHQELGIREHGEEKDERNLERISKDGNMGLKHQEG